MSNMLPNSVDILSARVMGFDVDAYINDKPSTLHQRLNIPNTAPGFDRYTPMNSGNAKKKDKMLLAGLAALGASALMFLGIGAATKKINLKNIKDFFAKGFKSLTSSKAKNGNKSDVFKNIRTKATDIFNSVKKRFKKS